MKEKKHSAVLQKISSVSKGFATSPGGGLPLGRHTLLIGRPRRRGKNRPSRSRCSLRAAPRTTARPGIFVAFEEMRAPGIGQRGGHLAGTCGSSEEADLFSSSMPPWRPDVVKSGAFESHRAARGAGGESGADGAKLIVFDAIDVAAGPARRSGGGNAGSLYRLHEMARAPRVDGAYLTTKID